MVRHGINPCPPQTASTYSYTYDALNRLTGITNPDASTASYRYDNAGNRTNATVSGVMTPATFDGADQMLANGTTNYTYDANGNLTSAGGPNGTTSYTWDAQDRLINVAKGTSNIGYGYDAFGRMTSRTDSKSTTSYVYDGGNPLLVQPTTAGTQAREFLPGAGGLPAGVFQASATYTSKPSVAYYQRDGLGSVVGLAGSVGTGPAVAVPSGYDAWGTPSGLSDRDDTYGLPLA